eukprot:2492464-Amphidinium_carterae.1
MARQVVGTASLRAVDGSGEPKICGCTLKTPLPLRKWGLSFLEQRKESGLEGSGPALLQEIACSFEGQVLRCSLPTEIALCKLSPPSPSPNFCPFPVGRLFGSRRRVLRLSPCQAWTPGFGPSPLFVLFVGSRLLGGVCKTASGTLSCLSSNFAVLPQASARHSRQWPCVDLTPHRNAWRCSFAMKSGPTRSLRCSSWWRSRMTPPLRYGVVKKGHCFLSTLDFPAQMCSRQEAPQASLRGRSGMPMTPISGEIGGIFVSQGSRGSVVSPSRLLRLSARSAFTAIGALK